jgi:hypothetical protein
LGSLVLVPRTIPRLFSCSIGLLIYKLKEMERVAELILPWTLEPMPWRLAMNSTTDAMSQDSVLEHGRYKDALRRL